MADATARDLALPDEFVDAVVRRAAARGLDEAVAAAFVRGVLRRLPPDLAEGADPRAAIEGVVELLAQVAASPGPTVRLDHRPPSLDASGPAVGVVQIHGLDRPFLLATVLATLRRLDLGTLRALHPIIGVERDDDGRLTAVLPARTADRRESIIHVELDRALTEDQQAELEQELRAALADVEAATDDWDQMRARLRDLAARIRSGELSPQTDEELREEVASLLTWLDAGNLVLLGMHGYDVDGTTVTPREGSGLGILRDGARAPDAPPTTLPELPPAHVDQLLAPQLVRVSRTEERSRVQRHAPMDAITVLERDEDDRVVGMVRLLGLFTRGALAQPARTTPVLRRRLARLLEAEDVVAGSYDEAQLTEVFEAIPRDELFAASPQELRRMVVDLVVARERDDVRAVVRHDAATNTVSIVATVPRYRYEPAVRRAFTAHLVELLTTDAGAPEVDVDVSLAQDHEVLVRFAVHLPSGTDISIPTAEELGGELHRLTRSWADAVHAELEDVVGEGEAHRLDEEVVRRLPQSYREVTAPAEAVADVRAVDEQVHDLDVRIVPTEDGRGRVRALVRGHGLVLSAFLPLLEDLGLEVLDERPHHLEERPGRPDLHLHDFGVRGLPAEMTPDDELRVADTLRACWTGRTSSDSLHRLVLSTDLTWVDVSVLRTYRRYRRQVGTAYTPAYVNDALAANPAVARAVVAYFHDRFDPDRDTDEADVEAARGAALAACDAVARLDHDRILRDLVALVGATLRTNVHARDDLPVVVLKLDPARVPDAPAPVPHRELFVLGPRVEGIHLRGGPVARGGLRWSDRQDDVRTEVLGLMKAQVLKNAVIVPTGAKGGFVLRQPPDDPAELRAEVRRQYEVFVEALLSVTDDLDGEDVVAPPGVRRWDGDDPYLVVAADKGTATFSDVANAVALRRGFWLGDAFASGGSKGYDHKALGITARGAWVAVRRHLLELGIHPEQEPVSVVGVGDMSGDVFGNGMLRSRTIRLLAAFDHRDVFLDPDPDPAASFAERQRLFDLPGASWQDYDRDVLSPGGMVVSRDAKSVELTDEVREALQTDAEALSPAGLVRTILRAPVDLLWFGGIGTYVKDPDERHEEVGDRANDELRIDADELRARVIGEGANLSLTQAARIRYARRGGRVDQDAIHNVGGVDCSDHEVNVKILLQAARRDGRIDRAERDRLLAAVTDDVVEDVLRDVDLQVWRISRDLHEGADRLVDITLLLELLEHENALDRAVQVLPDGEELRERREQGAGLTRPEHATLLGSAKRRLKDELLTTDLPDCVRLQSVLTDYVPDLLVERFGDQLQRHRLRRELVATRVANELVDRMGPTFPSRVAAEADFDEATVTAAWWTARDVTGIDERWRQLEGLLDEIGPIRQDELARELEFLLGSLTRRYATEPGGIDPDVLVPRDRDAVQAYAAALFELGTSDQRRHRVARAERLLDDLVPDELARTVAGTRDLALGPEVAATLRALGWDADRAPLVGDVLLHLLELLGLDRLHRVLERVSTTTVWRRRLRRSLAAELRQLGAHAAQLALTEQTSDLLADGGVTARRFTTRRTPALERARRTITAVEQDVQAGLDGVAVALRVLRTAVEGRDR